ncbi:MAG: hypothetical protein A2W61_04985 [Deltaproteobacteria bacterium RIFCSPLOWO2_01_44_7]|nr:MAG: hypothetical protein A2712_00575 [Deltaproteobacteria bacterium RIFCSPHIGHO2_01_FULL_43_49]OGQ14230.1 MAG: hypothetical protein A3D22_10040 [Deltaproteobacteria bacterium RIFCSPHIGHO2_02_FULL_44_53]OGQ27446.1 MAG: hypothetical protein A3D98_03640 [Deltaproteobacteria bacterium RIFCSPHIGHO2_12_FULL_44_21]OGQ30694.1 MAG: hypothetical protein A2979_06065 [Deltaproteobacteria bacterium RIFCSPLOWO2_01_FULL_45_74]OGQ41423.1 MAG: hypothetical protein A2W61_04985 [Deltaproteobacteria bacterium 
MKIKIPKGKPQKSRGAWQRKPVTKVKESAKTYKRKWGLEDFVESVDKVMQKQEKENPTMKQVHAQLSPEWKRVSEKIGQLLMLTDAKEIDRLREEVVQEGEIATRVLIDFLLAIKNQSGQS